MGITAPVMGEAPTATLSLPPPPSPHTASKMYTSLSAPLTIMSADTAAAAATIAIPAPVPRKRSNDSSVVRVNRKKNRMASVNARCGFVEIDSSFRRSVVWTELVTLLRETVLIHPIKYHLKLEATYNIPKLEQSSVNRAFKTSARELYEFGDIDEMVEDDFRASRRGRRLPR
ncbi:uncharacterized protein LOC112681217 isoform X2 [Sipha flava]|uniref:Uncharacterized protein LOC112681217 isoform X2 n=1 Tax=Sipha flava TaxID=143950 RepID=A0A8B8FA75_9HEMI|nr:uncharacterized protein LOC112681217 isoform X2 [Sipha flava]